MDYLKATGTAVFIACSMRALTPFLIGTSRNRMMNYIIGYSATAISSCVNVYCMRENEL